MEALAGGARHVFDYLADEVLSRQPEDVRDFLLRTSVVETLSGPLCEALTDRTDGLEMLERLERKTCFWCRWTMRAAITATTIFSPPSCANACNAKAPTRCSNCTAAPGSGTRRRLPGLGYRARLAAEDFDRAADLIEEETGVRRTYVDASLLLRWLGTLPDDLVRPPAAQPALRLGARAFRSVGRRRAPAPGYRGSHEAR